MCGRMARTLPLCLVLVTYGGVLCFPDHRAPMFTLEPPSKVVFLNSTGATVHCSAVGNPRPTMSWVMGDGSPVSDLPGLRMSLSNGSLIFLPFRADVYRQDIHSALYRCIASNSVGRTGSRDVRVRAVVRQRYQVQVYDEFVIRGNTAVLRCQVPSFVRDYVIVTTWEREDGITIVSNIASGGRYSVLSNGELHIRNAMTTDGFKSYRCLTQHLLSGDVQLSTTSGRLIITDPQGTHPPRLSDTRNIVNVRQGSPAELTCVGQSFPLPTYRWYKKEGLRLIPVNQRSGSLQLSGSLYFQQVNIRDSGTYVCVVNNSAGEKRLESTLTVTAPLAAYINPQRVLVDAERSVTLKCNVSGHPFDAITWVKDQRPLPDDGTRIRFLTREMLSIASVGREDRGVYQCYVRNTEDSAQAAAEVVLGEAVPVFLETFSDQTIQPGPSVSLQCIASGTPLPQVTWSLDGFPVPDNDRVRVGDYVSRSGDVVSHVNISNVRVEDGGFYTCSAKNDAGEVRHSGQLNVFGPPVIRPMPDVSVIAGETFSVKCRVSGYPVNEITWTKDGRRLPTNRRQQSFPNGTLSVEDIQRSEDEGVYTCSARNIDGALVHGTLKITVKEKPVILPFIFPPETQKEGMKIRVLCAVAAGDPPFTLTWLKDGQPLPPHGEVTVRTMSDDYSSLTIDSASPRHNGKYTCLARNDAATVNYTASLTVQVPPRWRIQPSDVSVLMGRSITLNCQAEGYPHPQIRWEKASGAAPREYRPISTSYHHQVFENGSLTIQEVTQEDAGFYLCQATNGIGSGLSSVISLSVHVAPRFDTKFRTQMVKKGEDVTLACLVAGDPPLSISWTRDKQPLNVETEARFQMTQSSIGNTGMRSDLIVVSANRMDSALYTCVASNTYGQDDTNIQLIVQEPPDTPREIQMNEIGSRYAKVNWEPPFSGNSLITRYTVFYRENGSLPSQQVLYNMSVPGTDTSLEARGLRPASSYEIYLTAENAIGTSPPGRKITFATEEEVPEGPPQLVKLESMTSQSLKVSWEAPQKALKNGHIKGYYIGYKEVNSSQTYQYKTIEIVSSLEPRVTCDLRGLKKYTQYSIVVQAFNRKGAGPRSDPIYSMTLEDVPSLPPQQVDCVPLSSQSLKVMWTPPPAIAIHGVLEGYKVLYRSVEDIQDSEEQEIVMKGTDVEVTVKNLEKFTNYSISALAYSGKGDGVLSDLIYCRTLEDVPSPPADIKAMPMLPDAILVSWLPPMNPNGIIQQYTLYQRVTSAGKQATIKQTLSATQLYYEALRLERNRRYEFWVTASTFAGESEGTRVLSQTTSDTVPARIASFSQQMAARRKTAIYLPCRIVGIPAPERTWTYRNKVLVDGVRTKVLLNGSLEIVDIEESDSGNYTCKVQNVYGADEIRFHVTVRAKHIDGIGLPPPTSVILTGSTSSSLHVSWSGETRGRARVKGYIIRYKREFGQWEEVKLPSKTTSYTLDNLQCGTKYSIYVAGIDKGGEGEHSDILTGKTEGIAPLPPSKENFITPNSSSLILHLSAWDDGGCPIKSFVIRYKRVHASEWRPAANNAIPHQEKVLIRDLSPGKWYKVRVTAHNGAGSMVSEFEVSTLTLEGGTVAPIILQESRENINIWEDVNIIVPIVAAFIALSVVIGVAVCVCVKKRHNSDDIYQRAGLNSNGENLESSQPPKKSVDSVPVRDNSMYQTCVPKLPVATVGPPVQGEQGNYYEDDITPYATFRLPGCDSDTESSHGTVRELQTFGQQYRRSFFDPASQLPEQYVVKLEIDQKCAEYPTYDPKWSSLPSHVYRDTTPYLKEEWVTPGDRCRRREIYRKLICLMEPYRSREDMESDVDDLEYEKRGMEEDLLVRQEMSEAECDWDRLY